MNEATAKSYKLVNKEVIEGIHSLSPEALSKILIVDISDIIVSIEYWKGYIQNANEEEKRQGEIELKKLNSILIAKSTYLSFT